MVKMNQRNHEEHIRHSFDSFCKIVIKRKSIDIHRENKHRRDHELSLSDLSLREIIGTAVTDRYFADEHIFSVIGESVGVASDELAEALKTLPADRREIVMMSYFFDMSDREIAERLNMARRTVAYRREKTLVELRIILESEV